MDPMNTPDQSNALPVISSGCNRLRSARAPCSAPLLSSKHTELLRALTAYSSASMSTGRPRGHHDHSQRLEVALVYYRRRGVKALPSGLQRPSASVTAVCWWRLAGSTAPYDSSHKGKSGPPSRPPPLSLGSVHSPTHQDAGYSTQGYRSEPPPWLLLMCVMHTRLPGTPRARISKPAHI